MWDRVVVVLWWSIVLSTWNPSLQLWEKILPKGFQKVSDFSWLGESNNVRRPAWHLLQIQAMDDFTMNAMKDTGWVSKCGTEGRRWQSGFFGGLVSYMLDSKYVSIYLFTIYDIYIYKYILHLWLYFRLVSRGFWWVSGSDVLYGQSADPVLDICSAGGYFMIEIDGHRLSQSFDQKHFVHFTCRQGL